MAAQWLRDFLSEGPVAVAEIFAAAEAAGLAWATVRRAADRFEIIAAKTGYEAGWTWRLPDDIAAGEEIEL